MHDDNAAMSTPTLPPADLRETLLRQHDVAWKLASHHLEGLTTAECLWRPAGRGLHVRAAADGTWIAEWPEHEGYHLGPPSIAWVTWHIGWWWSMVLDHSFGERRLAREHVLWPGSAAATRAWLRSLQTRWQMALADPALDLASTAHTHWPYRERPFADVAAWVNVELTKNAAEIGLLRFLHAAQASAPADARLAEVVDYWRRSRDHWFAKSDAFDAEFRERCAELHEQAASGAIEPHDAVSALALVLLLDQYPRNAFRGTPRMFATDAAARAAADAAIARGHDAAIEHDLRVFFYLPFEHSEALADQERSLELHRAWDPKEMRWAEVHHDIVRRFGRFPHRNAVLGRSSTPEEEAYLASGGFQG